MKTALSLIFLAILIFCAWTGYKKGFIMGVGSLLAFVISVYGANLLANTYSGEVIDALRLTESTFGLKKAVEAVIDTAMRKTALDGVPRKEIAPQQLQGSLAVVDQDIMTLPDTVDANIRLWDRSIQDYEVILAAHDADIHDAILEREAGYHEVIAPRGRNFSGGQLQRLEIARALAADPSVIILDEATSALDAKTEANIIQAVRNRGITCIVVAHRLSTIRDCDEIIVLREGSVVERGTHDQLITANGAYAELVRSN